MATIEEIRLYAEQLETRIKALEDMKGESQIQIETKPLINIFEVIKTNKLIFDGFYSQTTAPTILLNSMAFWKNTTGGGTYFLIFNFNGTQKTVALT
jgi:hypothetical protein